jgi:hypothetical protein
MGARLEVDGDSSGRGCKRVDALSGSPRIQTWYLESGDEDCGSKKGHLWPREIVCAG